MSGRVGRGDGSVGRLLVASLHQAIGEVMPQRLEYYEHWLGPMGLREGRNGLAPLGAVLSFLRQEGRDVYDDVMTRAGRASAEWYQAEDALGARVMQALPTGWRRRMALARSRRLLTAAFAPATARVRAGRGTGHVELSGSVFCAVREPWPWPTCAYVAAAIERHLALCRAEGSVALAECRATGADACRFEVAFAPPAGTSGEAGT